MDYFAKFQVVWSGDTKTPKSTILGHVLGIFGILRGVKGTPDQKTVKFYLYLLKILPTHESRQL
jgi:hypothetical protein